jgi:tetratricopeptide (TPR) repeat protein
MRGVENRRWDAIVRRLTAAAFVVAACGACTPPQQLLMSLLPDGTIPVLLSHFESVGDTNRRRISELEQRRDWDGLATFAEENLKKDKSNADWWLVAGYAYSQGGQRKRAIECYGEVVRLSPEDPLGWNLLAQSYRLNSQPDRAMQIVNRALNVNRDSPATWFLQGEIYSDIGRFEPAIGGYREAIKLDQQFAQAWLGLGKAYARLGRTTELKQVSKALEKLDPAMARELAAAATK